MSIPEVPFFPHWQHQNVVWWDILPRSKPAPGQAVVGSVVPLMPHLAAPEARPARCSVLSATLPATGPRHLGKEEN